MITNTPSLDLIDFVETQILPRYAAFDRAHGMEHVTRVVRRSLALARTTGADINMVYVVAAYHDLGMAGPRAVHHLTGGRILMQDARLKRWFSPEQLNIMKEAVEDHRASASRAPRSVYGKIVAEADRDLAPETVFMRAVQYGLDNSPELDREGQWQRFKLHMDRKYSTAGYIRLWIHGSENERNLTLLRDILARPQQLRQWFEQCYDRAIGEQ